MQITLFFHIFSCFGINKMQKEIFWFRWLSKLTPASFHGDQNILQYHSHHLHQSVESLTPAVLAAFCGHGVEASSFRISVMILIVWNNGNTIILNHCSHTAKGNEETCICETDVAYLYLSYLQQYDSFVVIGISIYKNITLTTFA